MLSHGAQAEGSVFSTSIFMKLSVLILGGTTEGRLLAERLAGDPRFRALLSFAGRTENIVRPHVPHRVGGFGGVSGLASFLRDERFDALIDATHPFAARMSEHAVHAAAEADVPLLRLARPAWRPVDGDRWTKVSSFPEAADALGAAPRKVFLTVGRLEIAAFHRAPQHDYLVRAVDAFDPGLPRARVLTARGPFALEDELALFAREHIDVIVSKNAGTRATYAKLEAARAREVPVIMVERPTLAKAREVETIDAVEAWLSARHTTSASRRGE